MEAFVETLKTQWRAVGVDIFKKMMELAKQTDAVAEKEYWAQMAMKENPFSVEPYVYLTYYFRNKLQYHKAWQYMIAGEAINAKALHFERCIISYYVQPHKSHENLSSIISYYNSMSTDLSMYNNIAFYVLPLESQQIRSLTTIFVPYKEYVPSSVALLSLPDGNILMNARYVNYQLSKANGAYHIADEDRRIKTHNFVQVVTDDFKPIGPLTMMNNPETERKEAVIGLEDVRLFKRTDGRIGFVAASLEFSNCEYIRQVRGVMEGDKFIEVSCMSPPSHTTCEKNWVPINENRFIYCWHPLKIGTVDSENVLQIKKEYETPSIFRHIRGSTGLFPYRDATYAITHMCMESTPRKYFHVLVKLDSVTLKLLAHTVPFNFLSKSIEYTLGLHIQDDVMHVTVSQFDGNPVLISYNFDDLKFVSV